MHGINGIFGTLANGLWAIEGGLFYGGGMAQLGIQALGVGAATAYVFPVSLLMFLAIKATVGLRVTPEIEEEGIDTFYHGMASYPEFTDEGVGFDLEKMGAELAGAD